MSNLPEAKVWEQLAAFVECPKCMTVNCLGEDVKFAKGDTHQCTFCDLEFALIGPEEESKPDSGAK